jgi:ATP-dependent Lon protease
MTGEITLRGRVLPIGGLKEKLLAALRGGIKTVIIPEENVKDLTEISNEIKSKMDIVPAARVDDVLKWALVRVPERISWDEAAEAQAVKPEEGEPGSRVTAH